MQLIREILIFVVALTLASSASASKILFLVAFPGKSQWLMFEPVINELLNRGHEVTAITNYPLKTESKNYSGLIIEPQFDRYDQLINMTEFFNAGGKSKSVYFKIFSLWQTGLLTTKVAFDAPIVKDFIANDRTPFDLVISEQFQQEAFNMFAHKYNCPLITVGTLDYSDFMDHAKGSLTPLSFVPHSLSSMTDQMSLLERIENTVVSIFDAIGRKFYYLPKQTQLAREAFVALENQLGGKLPSVQDLERKIAVHLINSHPALSYPRPKMPGMVDIAGIHIRKPKPLPEDIQTFLDEAPNGVIYISFGTFLRSSDMPAAKYQAMLTVFRKIKQRVLWKWESDEVPNLPSNVMVKKWLPQSDVLAHKKVQLFINHGGVFGAQEAIYHAVPMIIYPFYGDQHLNGNKLEQRGVALVQAMSEITSESLYNAIQTVTSNQDYYKNIQKMSDIFRTNQNEPLDTAIYWIEYVLKYKGADHLQSPAKKLSWIKYLQIDLLLLFIGVPYMIIDFIYGLLKKKESSNDSKKNSDGEKKENEKKTSNQSQKKSEQPAKKSRKTKPKKEE